MRPPQFKHDREAYPCGTVSCIGVASYVAQHHIGLRREVFVCFVCGGTWDTYGDPAPRFKTWAEATTKGKYRGI